MSDQINFDTAEKFSYAYVDDKYAKVAITAAGSAVLADPNAWSYAETHSYVKVDPSSLSINVPSGVDEIYAKVVYLPNLNELVNSFEIDPMLESISSKFATRHFVKKQVSGLASTEYVDNELSGKHDLITETNKLSYSLLSGDYQQIVFDQRQDIASEITYTVDSGNILLGTTSALSETPSGNIFNVNIGYGNEVSEILSFARGKNCKATGKYSFANGYKVQATGMYSLAEGATTVASNSGAHAEGEKTTASGEQSHAEGYSTTANANRSHSEGESTFAFGIGSHVEGISGITSGTYSHAEGFKTTANGYGSHAEGYTSKANGECSHSEGQSTIAEGKYSHAEGKDSNSKGNYSHSEGDSSKANGNFSHAEGRYTVSKGDGSHSEGYGTYANGTYSHAEGNDTTAGSKSQHVEGRWNIIDNSDKYQHIVGNGVDGSNRINIQTFDWEGNEWISGNLSAANVIAGEHILSNKADKSYVDSKISEINSSSSNLATLSANIKNEIQNLISESDPIFKTLSSNFATSNWVNENYYDNSNISGFVSSVEVSSIVKGFSYLPSTEFMDENKIESSYIIGHDQFATTGYVESKIAEVNTSSPDITTLSANIKNEIQNLISESDPAFASLSDQFALESNLNFGHILEKVTIYGGFETWNNRELDIDKFIDPGMYFVMSAWGYQNMPSGSSEGCIMVLDNGQLFIDGTTGRVSYRHQDDATEKKSNNKDLIYCYKEGNNQDYSGNSISWIDSTIKSDLSGFVTSSIVSSIVEGYNYLSMEIFENVSGDFLTSSTLSTTQSFEELSNKVDSLSNNPIAYDLSIDKSGNFFTSGDFQISTLVNMDPVIVSSFTNTDTVLIPSTYSSEGINYNNLLTREIWIGVLEGESITFNSSLLSSNYDLIGDIPETLSGLEGKSKTYHIFVMRCNTSGTIGCELAYSHAFRTNGDFE